jgi:transmembrane 9 superfamily protein 2/4
VFLIFLTLNFFLIGAGSSAAVPFTTILALIFMFFLVSVPLCFVGAYLGFKKPRIEAPVRTNQIPRQIPEQPFYLRTWTAILMGGILPFGAIFIELYFIMNSIWGQQIYYVFGFLFFVGLILLITCAEVTILMCYFQLCAEVFTFYYVFILQINGCRIIIGGGVHSSLRVHQRFI